MFDVAAFRAILLEVMREAIREEFGQRGSNSDEYLSVGRAAALAEVSPGTIRLWMNAGKLGRHRAGRELRVKRADLERLLRCEAPTTEPSPEERAHAILARRAARRAG